VHNSTTRKARYRRKGDCPTGGPPHSQESYGGTEKSVQGGELANRRADLGQYQCFKEAILPHESSRVDWNDKFSLPKAKVDLVLIRDHFKFHGDVNFNPPSARQVVNVCLRPLTRGYVTPDLGQQRSRELKRHRAIKRFNGRENLRPISCGAARCLAIGAMAYMLCSVCLIALCATDTYSKCIREGLLQMG